MKKRLFMILGSMLLVFALPFLIRLYQESDKAPAPLAEDGMLDLRGWDFSRNGTVPLKGEWAFYPNKLLSPEDLYGEGQAEPAPYFVHVPGVWNAYNGLTAKDGTGAGTFHLQIKLGESDRLFAIKTDNIRMSNRIFINGHEVGGSGIPSDRKGQGTSGNIPFVALAPSGGDMADIVVQVANYSYATGGIMTPILFGEAGAIIRTDRWHTLYDLISVVGFFIFFIYFLYAFFLRFRQKETIPLYLCLLCFFSLLYVLTHGQKLIGLLDPQISNNMILRLQLASSTMVYFFLIVYSAKLLLTSIPRVIKLLIYGLALGQIVVALLVPTQVFSGWEKEILGSGMLFICLTLYLYIRRLWTTAPSDNWLDLLSAISLLGFISSQFLNALQLWERQELGLYEMMLFMVVQLFQLTKRFADAQKQAEALYAHMLVWDGIKDEFVASTSHELRTPLHAIMNTTESVIKGVAGKPSPEQTEYLALVLSMTRRLSIMVDGLLDFTQLRQGKMKLERRPVDLAAVTESVWEVLWWTAGNPETRFITRWPEGRLFVYMDESKLQQILFTLLGNALKYSRNGEIQVGAVQTGDTVTIRVADDGTGMSGEELNRIRMLFDQTLDGVLHEESLIGAGIGLSVTRELVKLAGGTIEVNSDPDTGTEFRFTLPAAEPPPVGKEEGLMQGAVSGQEAAAGREAGIIHPYTAKPSASALQGLMSPEITEHRPHSRGPVQMNRADRPASLNADMKLSHLENVSAAVNPALRPVVLAVDDDPVNLKILQGILLADEYEVITADSGQAALEQITQNPGLDLIITDWMMPEITGLELCRRIRERFLLSELPILMLTARSRLDDIEAGFAAGVNDFLSKPVRSGELISRVKTLTQLRSSVKAEVRSEMAFLQAQIKPHFLYNALNTIIASCLDDPEKTMEMLFKLSQYLRGSFDFQNSAPLVKLGKELELVEAYIYLEQARFGTRLQYECRLEAGEQVLIPPLSIQPIIENAVRHGVMKQAEGGKVELVITSGRGNIQIRITDNGVGMQAEEARRRLEDRLPGQGVGLKNIHKRLITLFGKGLQIEGEAGQGTTVWFEIPVISGTRPGMNAGLYREDESGGDTDESGSDR